MALNIITGLPGAGKTIWLSRIARKALNLGIRVYSNIPFNYKGDNLIYYSDIHELLKAEDGIIVMDEMHAYLDARSWENLTPQFRFRLFQHRKFGLDIWGTAQHILQVDVAYRRLIEVVVDTKKLLSFNVSRKAQLANKKPFGLFYQAQYWGYEFEKWAQVQGSPEPESIYSEFFLLSRKDREFYDTMGLVPFPYAICPECNRIMKAQCKGCRITGYRKKDDIDASVTPTQAPRVALASGYHTSNQNTLY